MSENPLIIGLLINPIAGMGGAVGLKGTDGSEILLEAKSRGAEPQASRRAKEFLHELRGLKSKIKILTVKGIMGGDIVESEGFQIEYISDSIFAEPTMLFHTNSSHTIEAAKLIANAKISLLVFVGGDGTARNICEAIDGKIPCLGIPGGVKIHSSVFATNPVSAGQLTLQYLWGEAPLHESEVLDIDENAFRDNKVISKLYGYLNTPYSPTLSQPSKMATPQTEDEFENQQRIGQWIIEEMEQLGEDWDYILGPGTTPRAVAIEMGAEKTLLGADFYHNKQLIAKDLNEEELLEKIGNNKIKLIVTPIGAQGFIFGRGNLQFSPKVLQTIGFDNIIIIATKYKVSTLPDHKLRIDSRDPDFDKKFKGYYRVLVDYAEYRILSVE